MDDPKISSLIPGQLPEFIQNDYPMFVEFIQAYYDYLSTVLRLDYANLRDVDNTLDSFIQYFKSEIAYNLPNVKIDERFLLRHIKDLYKSKGSEASYKLLFKILFNKDIELGYPGNKVLRASDGKWNQDTSFFVQINSGSPDDIVGKSLIVKSSDKDIMVFIERYQSVTIQSGGTIITSPNIVEVFINRIYHGTIKVGDRLIYDYSFDGTILSTNSKIKIKQPGKNFKAGQLYNITDGNGIGCIIKVLTIDANGGISTAQFIDFGVNYNNMFITNLVSPQNKKSSAPIITIS